MKTSKVYHQPQTKAKRNTRSYHLVNIREVAIYADQYNSMQEYWNEALKETNRFFMKLKLSNSSSARIITKNKRACFDISSAEEEDQHLGISDLSLKELGVLHFTSEQSLDTHITVLSVFYDEILYGNNIDMELLKDELLDYLYEKNIAVELRSIRDRIKFLTEFQASTLISYSIGKLSFFDEIKKQPKPQQWQMIEQKYPPLVIESLNDIPREYPYFAVGSCFLADTETITGSDDILSMAVPKHLKKYKDIDQQTIDKRVKRQLIISQEANKRDSRRNLSSHKNREYVRRDIAIATKM